MTDYKVIYYSTLAELETEVKVLLGLGWTILDGAKPVIGGSMDGRVFMYFYQTLVKTA